MPFCLRHVAAASPDGPAPTIIGPSTMILNCGRNHGFMTILDKGKILWINATTIVVTLWSDKPQTP